MAVSNSNNKTQMVLSHDNSITVSNGQQPPVTSARQPSVKFIHPNITFLHLESNGRHNPYRSVGAVLPYWGLEHLGG